MRLSELEEHAHFIPPPKLHLGTNWRPGLARRCCPGCCCGGWRPRLARRCCPGSRRGPSRHPCRCHSPWGFDRLSTSILSWHQAPALSLSPHMTLEESPLLGACSLYPQEPQSLLRMSSCLSIWLHARPSSQDTPAHSMGSFQILTSEQSRKTPV